MHSRETKEKRFAALVAEHQGLLIKVSRLYTHCPEDEQDLFQEIVLQLWKSFDSFRGGSKISTWMYRVALNTAITLFRKKSRQPDLSADLDYVPDTTPFVEEELDENVKLLYRVIKMLPKVERALVMMYLEDVPYREIAETLGITEGNARVKMNRLKKTLKELMEQHA